MNARTLALLTALWPLTILLAQESDESRLERLQEKIDRLEAERAVLLGEAEDIKLAIMRRDLTAMGLPALAPGEHITQHPGHALVWDERHHVPKWTAHIVMPDIMKGNLARIDSFRPDPALPGSTDLFDEYWFSGYDRGHMVPSADMRWSRKALEATYLYSNIAPQKPELNRGGWADLEDWGRRYVHYAQERVFIVTGPVIGPGLPILKTPKTIESVSIPTWCFKAFADLDGPEKKGIAFVMRNGPVDRNVLAYAVSIDSVEKLTGLDLFASLDDETENSIEAMTDVKRWMVNGDPTAGDVPPLKAPLPGGRFNTSQAKYHIGQTATICGTVVSTRRTTKANAVYLNLDRNHPNQEFYATIWDYNSPNFHYDPVTFLQDKRICVTGKITMYDDIPRISVNNEKEIEFWDDIVK